MNTVVSVAMPTYNHERFIGPALDSVLSQCLDDSFEIVVGVDHSDDSTLEIVRRYHQAHPDVIRVIDHNTRVGGRRNNLDILRKCQGQYISHLDGDDLMLPGKLAKQVAFLNQHPDAAFVGHNLRILREGDDSKQKLFTDEMAERTELLDLVRFGTKIGHASIMYRANCMDIDTFERMHQETHGDWFMQILAARNGWVGYIDEVLGVYRIHQGGITQLWKTVSGKHRIYETQRAFLTRCLELGVPEFAVREGIARIGVLAAKGLFGLRAYKEFRLIIKDSWMHCPHYSHWQTRAFRFRYFPLLIRILRKLDLIRERPVVDFV